MLPGSLGVAQPCYWPDPTWGHAIGRDGCQPSGSDGDEVDGGTLASSQEHLRSLEAV